MCNDFDHEFFHQLQWGGATAFWQMVFGTNICDPDFWSMLSNEAVDQSLEKLGTDVYDLPANLSPNSFFSLNPEQQAVAFSMCAADGLCTGVPSSLATISITTSPL